MKIHFHINPFLNINIEELIINVKKKNINKIKSYVILHCINIPAFHKYPNINKDLFL